MGSRDRMLVRRHCGCNPRWGDRLLQWATRAISDSLLSVRIVIGTGQLLTVSATSNADLFWGIKDAGFNYGVVTEATYRIYDFTNEGQAMSADMTFPASRNGSIWQLLKAFVGNQPSELALKVAVGFEPTTGVCRSLVSTDLLHTRSMNDHRCLDYGENMEKTGN